MPKVGKKEFPYTPEGEGQAEVYAAQTNQPITREEKDSFGYGTYQEGGGVEEQKPDLQGYLNSDDHKEWLNSPWDSENDIHMLKTIIGAMHMHGDYGEENNQKYLEDYATMLEQVSNKKGAPPAKELHDTLREMQYGKQRGGPVKDQFGYGSYQGGGLFSGAEQRASAGNLMGSSGLFSGAEQRESIRKSMEVSWDDPWGDNISIPHRNGDVVTGPEADEYSPFGGQGFESILYKGHTFQEIDTDQYNQEDIDKAIAWYREAGQKTSDYIDKYSDDPKVMAAQERKMKEIQFMLQQLAGGMNASAMIQRDGFAGKFGY